MTLDLLESRAQLVAQASPDRSAPEVNVAKTDHQERSADQDRGDQPDLEVNAEKTDQEDPQVHLDPRDQEDLEDPPENEANLENLEASVKLATQVDKARGDLVARRENKESLVHSDYQDHRARADLMEREARSASPE